MGQICSKSPKRNQTQEASKAGVSEVAAVEPATEGVDDAPTDVSISSAKPMSEPSHSSTDSTHVQIVVEESAPTEKLTDDLTNEDLLQVGKKDIDPDSESEAEDQKDLEPKDSKQDSKQEKPIDDSQAKQDNSTHDSGTKTTKEHQNEGRINKKETKKQKQAARAKELGPIRSFEEDCEFLEQITPVSWKIKIGFVDNMKAEGIFFVNDKLKELTFGELQESKHPDGIPGGFIPALKQIANVAALPGIVKHSIGLPDVHSGYGFAIGNTAAFNMDDPDAIVSPGGVGFDINCGVRLIRTNLMESEVAPRKEELAQALFDSIPVGVGARGIVPMNASEIDEAIVMGLDWCDKKGISWPEDKFHCEEQGRMPNADASKVSDRAKQRGLPQLGTLGAGNHYGEVQVVEEIYNPKASEAMGITKVGQVVIMVHCGSRGLGHQVATDALMEMEKAMARDNINVNDRQLACATINSKEGQNYLAGMSAAANFAWVNRSAITMASRKAFSDVFKKDPREMDMHVVYDVSHNIAKTEKHKVGDTEMNLLVHRKGSTRAFPPGDLRIPEDYREIGQPVLIGGTMGTCSYVLTGTHKGMDITFGSTCHGAGRVKSRAKSRRDLDSSEIQRKLAEAGICVKVASPKLIMEEAPESYKDVVQVIETCDEAEISKKAIRMRPIAVIKG